MKAYPPPSRAPPPGFFPLPGDATLQRYSDPGIPPNGCSAGGGERGNHPRPTLPGMPYRFFSRGGRKNSPGYSIRGHHFPIFSQRTKSLQCYYVRGFTTQNFPQPDVTPPGGYSIQGGMPPRPQTMQRISVDIPKIITNEQKKNKHEKYIKQTIH